MTSDLVPLSVADGAWHGDGGVAVAQVEAQVGLALLQLNGGKVGVVDAGHVEHQTRLGCGADLKLDAQAVERWKVDSFVLGTESFCLASSHTCCWVGSLRCFGRVK